MNINKTDCTMLRKKPIRDDRVLSNSQVDNLYQIFECGRSVKYVDYTAEKNDTS